MLPLLIILAGVGNRRVMHRIRLVEQSSRRWVRLVAGLGMITMGAVILVWFVWRRNTGTANLVISHLVAWCTMAGLSSSVIPPGYRFIPLFADAHQAGGSSGALSEWLLVGRSPPAEGKRRTSSCP